MSESLSFKMNTPCKSCPYRKGAALQLWHSEEYAKLLSNEKDYMGVVYACHKKNGCVCIGWLMMQDKMRIPSIALRLKLSRDQVKGEYLDFLHCASELYESTEEMVLANYPELIK